MSKKVISENDDKKQSREIVFHPEKAVIRELGKVPERHRDRFLNSLSLIAIGEDPTCGKDKLDSVDTNVYELIINGRPAWRCIYYVEKGKVVVLHATEKTTNGADRQIKNVVEERLKTWQSLQKPKKK